ncbi:MAG: FAD-dependent oxidoreductase [Deltaproteobacteria bacterium]|jgi:predicted NAD/FAD-binding protein|nr:FAD-dependent oxidoreductase [Deltaproteobacteria bacterium]
MRIAVIGSGISGMVAAYLLCQDNEIIMYEANDTIGGHTNTIDVLIEGITYPVDTGFIVFNEKTYPNFIKLMRSLGVTWQPSNMSFSVQCDQTGLIFSPSSFNALFVQRKNLFRPSFYRMIWDALRFRREASELIRSDNYSITLQAYLEQNNYSQPFIEHFIIPMGEAIWSADPVQFREFPARYLVEFFNNHGFLNIRHQPQWLVIKGGSKQYIGPLTRPYKDQIRLNSPVVSVKRFPENVEITTKEGDKASFDQVVIATHSDQALQMLADSSDLEIEILSAIPYQENLAVLHTDKSLLPPKRPAWASWNYHIPKEEKGRVALTYNMNILQSLEATEAFCVTLNMPEKIHPDHVIQRIIYHHPVYDPNSLSARRKQDELNGKNRTYFCGAYWGYGFHEDGVNSALSVCKHFGKTLS